MPTSDRVFINGVEVEPRPKGRLRDVGKTLDEVVTDYEAREAARVAAEKMQSAPVESNIGASE